MGATFHGQFSFLFLVLVLIVAWMVLLLIFRRKPQPYADAASTKPCCGQCGYAVEGLPTFICPECGSDLREVGIVTAAQRTNPIWGRLGKTVLWTILIFAVGVVSLRAIQSAQRYVNVNTGKSTFARPQSNAYQQLVCDYSVSTSPQSVSGSVKLTLSLNEGGVMTLDVDRSDMSYVSTRVDKSEFSSGETLSTAAILDWLAAADIDTRITEIQNEARTMYNLAATSGGNRTQSFGGFSSLNSSSGSTRSPLYPWLNNVSKLTTLAWLGLWFLGMWRLMAGKTLIPMRSKIDVLA